MAVSIMAGNSGAQRPQRRPQAAHGPGRLHLPGQPCRNAHRPRQRTHARPGQGGLLRHATPPSASSPRSPLPSRRLILIAPWDPTILKEIEKAIQASDLGFNPQSDGKVIRVPVPPMTEERRRDVCKHINKVLEEHRTAVRNVRRDGNDALKKLAKEKKISEDEEKRALEEVQKMTDEEIRRMEELSRKKEAEVMQV